ncbi:MAG: CPBP family glutamic-type intramembrane protease [Pseudomonadota bacterium]
MHELIDWKIFLVLLTAGILGAQSVGPLNQSVLSSATSDPKSTSVSRSRVMTWTINMSVYLVVLSTAIFTGLILKVHLNTSGAPLIEAALRGTAGPHLWTAIIVPVLTGLALGATISPLALYQPREKRVDFYNIAIWKRLVAGLFHGGIVEEIVFRWFLLSLLVWLLSFLPGFTSSTAPNDTFWIANTIAALLFGFAHLPGSAATAPLTKIAFFLVIALNILVGLIYGYFFWISGIEAAMFAHMSTHVTLQPCASLLLRVRGIESVSSNKAN